MQTKKRPSLGSGKNKANNNNLKRKVTYSLPRELSVYPTFSLDGMSHLLVSGHESDSPQGCFLVPFCENNKSSFFPKLSQILFSEGATQNLGGRLIDKPVPCEIATSI
jgi:hypothetical protein